MAPEVMWHGVWNSHNLVEFYRYIRELKYEEWPDYELWIQLYVMNLIFYRLENWKTRFASPISKWLDLKIKKFSNSSIANSIPLSLNISTVNSKWSSENEESKLNDKKTKNVSRFKMNLIVNQQSERKLKINEDSKSLSSDSENMEFYTAKDTDVTKHFDTKEFNEFIEEDDDIEEKMIPPTFMQAYSTPFGH